MFRSVHKKKKKKKKKKKETKEKKKKKKENMISIWFNRGWFKSDFYCDFAFFFNILCYFVSVVDLSSVPFLEKQFLQRLINKSLV